ncbi:MAG: hypothetical protein KAG96_05170 [Ichthyobacteriaceae bacterium]|nr:hypothetical protein [Ichthyobacteriaceae bacterium]
MFELYFFHKIFNLLIWFGVYNYAELYTVTKLPEALNEASGIAFETNSTFWMINDSGNDSDIFLVNYKGEIIRKKHVANCKNIDWEELTKDEEGNLYIGDFGDNNRSRNNCKIIKISKSQLKSKNKTIHPEIINFKYSTNIKYDAEAMIYLNNSLYIFTKNRSVPFNGVSNIFKIDLNDFKNTDNNNNSIAQFQSSFITCTENMYLCWITSASINTDKSKIALLSSDRVFIYSFTNTDKLKLSNNEIIDLETISQKESIEFISKNELIITDEYYKKIGGKMYYISLDKIIP